MLLTARQTNKGQNITSPICAGRRRRGKFKGGVEKFREGDCIAYEIVTT